MVFTWQPIILANKSKKLDPKRKNYTELAELPFVDFIFSLICTQPKHKNMQKYDAIFQLVG